jgi:sugar-specific transcriptional regulator TrmB
MEPTQFIDIANNVSSVLLLIIAVWWFNKKLEKADEKNETLNTRVFELEKTFLITLDKNTEAISEMTDMLQELKREIKNINEKQHE